MRKMFSEKQIGNIALSQNEDNIKDLAWESVSVDHATDLVEPIIDTVNYGIQEGLIQAGEKVYQHLVDTKIVKGAITARFWISIYSSNSTAYTAQTLFDYIKQLNNNRISSEAIRYTSSSLDSSNIVISILLYGGTDAYFEYHELDLQNATITNTLKGNFVLSNLTVVSDSIIEL